MHPDRVLDLDYAPAVDESPRARPLAALGFLLMIVAALLAANLALLVHHFGWSVVHLLWCDGAPAGL